MTGAGNRQNLGNAGYFVDGRMLLHVSVGGWDEIPNPGAVGSNPAGGAKF